MEGHTVESLTELYKMVIYRFKANQYSYVDEDPDGFPFLYQLSHIVPVIGTSQLGLLHPENLVISLTHQNRQHGTKHFGGGKGIPRTAILPKYRVDPKATNSQVFEMILSVVGEAEFIAFAKAVKLQPSKKQQHISTLLTLLDKSNPEHQDHFKLLSDKTATTQALGALVQLLKGKTASGYKFTPDVVYPFRVYRDETIRLAKYRPELQPLADMLTEISDFMWAKYKDDYFLQSWECSALFDVLHGKPVSQYQEVFNDMFEGIMDVQSTAFLKYTSPVTVEAPVPVLGAFSSFADTLDEQTPYIVPTLAVGGYVETETPW
ncbi:hypothetical protein IV02_02970 [Pseudomonas syringae]|uniref:Uncharacterized protein n=2 Tax=Pseudomonas syringae TaxID=317 RepID=A0A085VHT6_PSESX|nr:hypothetical protein IV02_02970 [Pseudomonas syringae]